MDLFALVDSNFVVVHEVTVVNLELHVLAQLIGATNEDAVVVVGRSGVNLVLIHVPANQWEELAGVVDVYTAGAKKYGENRWQTLPNGVNRYMGAFFRHLTAYKRGEQFDSEDGCLHLDKCIWNMIAVRHCFLADKGINPNTSDYSALQQPNGKD